MFYGSSIFLLLNTCNSVYITVISKIFMHFVCNRKYLLDKARGQWGKFLFHWNDGLRSSRNVEIQRSPHCCQHCTLVDVTPKRSRRIYKHAGNVDSIRGIRKDKRGVKEVKKIWENYIVRNVKMGKEWKMNLYIKSVILLIKSINKSIRIVLFYLAEVKSL